MEIYDEFGVNTTNSFNTPPSMDKIEMEITARWKKEKEELKLKHLNELDRMDKRFTELLVKYANNIKGKPELEKYFN